MDSGFATPKLYDLMAKSGQHHLIKLKKNAVLSRLLDLSLLCPQDESMTILSYSETFYRHDQAEDFIKEMQEFFG